MDLLSALIGGRKLMWVATVRDPTQAKPHTGSHVGPAETHLGMAVDVRVTKEDDASQPRDD